MPYTATAEKTAQSRKRRQAWNEFIGLLEDGGALTGHGPLADKMAERIFVLPSYEGIARDELRQSWVDCMSASMLGIMQQRDPNPEDDTTALRQAGESRARAGVSVAEMLQTGVAFQSVLIELASEIAPLSPYRDGVLLEFFNRLQAWSAWAMAASAAGHRDAELEMQRRERAQQADFIRRVLTGSIAASEIALAADAYGLDRAHEYFAFCARLRPDTDLRAVERHLSVPPPSGRRAMMLTVNDGDLWGFAAVPPQGPAPLPIGVSPAAKLTDLSSVFHLATRALDTALALGVDEAVNIDDLRLRASVVADQEIGVLLHSHYVAPFVETAAGTVILETVERYLANDSRLEATAKELFVHANTVRYRLSRFEAVTGSSLRSNDTLVEVWWALKWHRLRSPKVEERAGPAPLRLLK